MLPRKHKMCRGFEIPYINENAGVIQPMNYLG